MVILGTTGMRASVTVAWPAMCRLYEGVTRYMYADTKGLVTTGVGFLIDSASAAQALPWKTKAGALATAGQVTTEWKRVKGKTSWTKYSGLNAVWKDSAVLFLDLSVVDAKLLETTQKFWARLRTAIPLLDSFPADSQLALMDLAWQNGPGFLDVGSVWTGTRAAVLAQDWAKAAGHVPGDVNSPRAIARRRLFSNAAAVVRLGLDPDVLWDTKTPTAPQEPDVSVAFRGGRTCTCVATSLPLVEQEMIRRGLIKHNIDVYQLGYRNDVSASAGTHAGGGNTDVAQFSDAQIDVWRLWGWTIQHRTKAQGFDMDHGHGWPLGCTHLSAGGRSQAAQWANRQNGLVSKGRVEGRWPIDDWKTAMKKRLAEVAEADQQKELELPTTSEVAKALATNKDFLNAVAKAVLDYDYIPNAGALTSNVDNESVATKTALTQLGKKSNSIEAKLDALIARFPASPPPAA